MNNYQKEWEPRKVDIKSGWKNNAKILSDITEFVNEELYIPDENEFMEKLDLVFEYLKDKYKITSKQ